MKYPTVSALCEGVAGAIRAKEGSTEKINPQDFVQRIENLQVGGGTSESSIEYLDVSGVEDLFQGQFPLRFILAAYCYRCKYNHPNGSGIKVELFSQVVSWVEDPILFEMLALEIDFKGNCETDEYGQRSIEEQFLLLGITQEQLDSIPRITKEQFYTLEL